MRLLILAAVLAADNDLSSDHYADRVLASLNQARTRPAEVADALRRFRRTFLEREVREDDPDRGWTSAEGVAAVDEATAVMDRQPALRPLAPSPLLARAARAHADEQAQTGAIGHLSASGARPSDRARAAGGDLYVTEVIAYGFDTPERAVRQLLVDDGVLRRGHRVLMLNPRLRYAGVACGPHPRLRTLCVIDLAETPDGSPSVPSSP